MAPSGRLLQRVAQRLNVQAARLTDHHLTCNTAWRASAGSAQLCGLTSLTRTAPEVARGDGKSADRPRLDISSGSTAGPVVITEPVASADVMPVVIACAGLAAIGAQALYLFGNMDAPLEVRARIKAEDFVYVCEGEGSVICKYVGRDVEWSGCLLQLVKEPSEGGSQESALNALRLRAELPRRLAVYCFQPQVVDRPQLVSLPEEDIRELDAHIFTGRPAGRRSQRLLSTAPAPATAAKRAATSGDVVALRFQDTFEGPPAKSASFFGSLLGEKPRQLLTAPLLTVDLRPGCGLQEVEGLPSREVLRMFAALGNLGNSKGVLAADPVQLFSGDASKAAAMLRTLLEVSPFADACRIYLDGKPLYPTRLPNAVGEAAPKDAERVDSALNRGKQEGCLPNTTADLFTALGSVLTASSKAAANRNVLSDLRLLQCFAAGEEVEKMAERLWQDLQKHKGAEALATLNSTESVQAAVSSAARKRIEKDRLESQQRQGRKLMALKQLSNRQETAVRDWLSSFLLGRAAFDAHLLVSFARVDTKVASDKGMQSYLQEYRFLPLKEILPDKDWSTDVWFRVTVVGMGKREPSEIARIASELEECVNTYREMSVSQ